MSAKQVHNQRYGGMTNDEYVATQAGSFFDCRAVDCRADSKSFKLAATNVASSVSTTSTASSVGFYCGNTAPQYSYESGGAIRRLSDMTSIGTIASIGTPRASIEFVDQTGAVGSFIAGSTGFSKHIVATGVVTNNIGVYSPVGLTPSSAAYVRPMLKSKLWIYCGDADGILRYAVDTQVIDRPLVLEKSDVVVSVLELGDQIIIFTKNGSNGRQYFWDGVSKLPNRMIEWFANPPYYAAIFKNQIYVLTQNGIYVSDGYNSQLLFRTDSTRLNLSVGSVPLLGQFPLFYDTTIDIFYFSLGQYGIYSYGERLPGFGKSLVRIYGGTVSYGFLSEQSSIYYMNDIGGTFYYTTLSGYAPSGYIITNPMIGDGFDQLKKSKKCRISYYLPSVTDTLVKIYVSYDDGSHTLLFTSSATNSVVGYNRRSFDESGQWYKRQIKIELISTNSTLSPRFYQITSIYDPIQDDAQ